MAATKRMSARWKDKVEEAELALRTAGAEAVTTSKGRVSVSDAFMRQFALVHVAELIRSGKITSEDILRARKEEISGLPARV